MSLQTTVPIVHCTDYTLISATNQTRFISPGLPRSDRWVLFWVYHSPSDSCYISSHSVFQFSLVFIACLGFFSFLVVWTLSAPAWTITMYLDYLSLFCPPPLDYVRHRSTPSVHWTALVFCPCHTCLLVFQTCLCFWPRCCIIKLANGSARLSSHSPCYRILGNTRIQQLFKWTLARYGHCKTVISPRAGHAIARGLYPGVSSHCILLWFTGLFVDRVFLWWH